MDAQGSTPAERFAYEAFQSQGSIEKAIEVLNDAIRTLRSHGAQERSHSHGSQSQAFQAIAPEPDARDQEEFTLVMLIPHSVVGTVIGKKGGAISDIQQSSEAKITMEKEDECPMGLQERKVLIEGTVETVCVAALLINRTIKEGARQGETASGHISIIVPNEAVRYLIGKNGGAIGDMEKETECKIQFEKEDQMVYTPGRKVTISKGTKDSDVGRAAALRLVLRRLLTQADRTMDSAQLASQVMSYAKLQRQQQTAYMSQYYGMLGYDQSVVNSVLAGSGAIGSSSGQQQTVKQDMFVPAGVVGLLIGKSGQFIRDLQEKSGTRIQIDQSPQQSSDERRLSIVGTSYAVQNAHNLIQNAVAGWTAKGVA
eukprot:Rmarinus@m.21953